MDNKDLQTLLDSTKDKIMLLVSNQNKKEVEKYINDLLSYQKQLDVEPTLVHIEMKQIDDKFDGDTFVIYRTIDGYIIYHQKNGFDFVVRRLGSAGKIYELCNWIIENKELANSADDDMKKGFEVLLLELVSSFQVLCALWLEDGLFADFKRDTITKLYDTFNKYFDKTKDMTPKKEDYEKAADFAETQKAVEEINGLGKELDKDFT